MSYSFRPNSMWTDVLYCRVTAKKIATHMSITVYLVWLCKKCVVYIFVTALQIQLIADICCMKLHRPLSSSSGVKETLWCQKTDQSHEIRPQRLRVRCISCSPGWHGRWFLFHTTASLCHSFLPTQKQPQKPGTVATKTATLRMSVVHLTNLSGTKKNPNPALC